MEYYFYWLPIDILRYLLPALGTPQTAPGPSDGVFRTGLHTMILISLLTALCFVSAFFTLGLGMYAWARNPVSPVNRLFLAGMLAGTYWALGEFLMWYPGSYGAFVFWLHASAFWPFAIALLFHFVVVLTGHPLSTPQRRWLLLLLVYVPAAIFSILGMFTDMLYAVSQSEAGIYYYHPVPGSPAYLAATLYTSLLMIWSLAICILAWRRTPRGTIRRQYRLVALCIGIVVAFGVISAFVLPSRGIYTPNLVFIGIMCFSLIITYTILRYGLFTLSAENVVPDIIRLMPDGFLLADTRGRIITSNATAAGILGVPETTLPGSSLQQYLPGDSYAGLREILASRGSIVDFEVVLDPAFMKTVSISGSFVRDPEGEHAGYLLLLRDITGRKASERALAVANERISLLTQLTRHDISNLITGLGGYLMLIEEKENSGSEVEEYVRSCIDIVGKIGHQLQFTREYQDLGMHQPTWQALDGMIERAIGDLPASGVAIQADPAPFEIYADPLIVKVFYNLLENAVRHGEHTTAITISVTCPPNRGLLIAVSDNGIGIRDEDKEKIFRYGSGKNTGLGLALSRDILAVTGINLAETGIHKEGARFEILVPVSGWRKAGQGNAVSSGDSRT